VGLLLRLDVVGFVREKQGSEYAAALALAD
jgi:hypothetical protein